MRINSQDITRIAVIGLGLTGRSCVRFLQQQGVTADLFDTREKLDVTALGKQLNVDAGRITLGALANSDFSQFQMLLVSPGIAISEPVLLAAAANGVLIWGDVELFSHFVKVPVLAITGSNGKTTVTTLLCDMSNDAGVKTVAAGNIGLPVLDVVSDDTVELFVLELSSFQLETIHQLSTVAATVLNVTDDHMDRYTGLADYALAKQRIYRHCELAIVNRQDDLTDPSERITSISFGLDKPQRPQDYGLFEGALYHGKQRLMACDELAMIGQHNQLNALAALALGSQVNLPLASMLNTLTQFSGLAHRCALVPTQDGITWLNDSKATNVGATLAALHGLSSHQGKLILIAGGDAKGGDLSPLKTPFEQCIDALILIGRDKQLFCDIYSGAVLCDSLEQAVAVATGLANKGDVVLLSPACASLDMFSNYMERGDRFIKAVEAIDVC